MDFWLALLAFILTCCGLLILIWAALHDLAARTVPNRLAAAIFVIGICVRAVDHSLLFSVAVAAGIFTVLFTFWLLQAIGGGDVKLWSASVLLVPPHPQMELSCLARILLAGGILGLVYLALRLVVARPQPGQPRKLAARVLRAEAWRISRKAPLPYAFAIAGGTIATLLPLPVAVLR